MVGAGETIGDRIAAIRAGETEVAFASKVGVHKNTLRRYEANDRDPDADFLLALTRLGYNTNWILTGKGPKWLPPDLVDPQDLMVRDVLGGDQAAARERSSKSARPQVIEPPAVYGPDTNLVMVPHLGIEAGAGAGRYQVSEELGEFAFRLDWLRKRGISPRNAGVATVRGPSMEDKLFDGDLVLIDRGDTTPRGGLCYVVRQGDEIIVKYLVRLPDGRIQATSENSGSFPPFTIELGVNIEIIGRVKADMHEWE